MDPVPGIRSPVDDVAWDDEGLLGLMIHGREQSLQGRGRVVNVADSEESVGRGMGEIDSVIRDILDLVWTLVETSPQPAVGCGTYGDQGVKGVGKMVR